MVYPIITVEQVTVVQVRQNVLHKHRKEDMMDHLQYGYSEQNGSGHLTAVVNIIGSSGTARSILSQALADEVTRHGLTAQVVGSGKGRMQSLADAGSYFGKVDLVVGDGLLLDAPGRALLDAAASEILFVNVWIESPNLNDKALRETYRQDQPMMSVSGGTEHCVATILEFLGQMPTGDHLTGRQVSPEEDAAQKSSSVGPSLSPGVDEEEERAAQHRADRRAYDKMLSRQ